MAALNLEMLEDLWTREKELSEQLPKEEGSAANQIAEQLKDLREALGIVVENAKVVDDLVDQWERDIEEGRIPDLDAQVEDLR